MFDFDSGDPANDTFGLLHGLNDLGEGDAEVMTATVDSGGPTLLGSKVAGVTSFRAHDVQGDSDGFLNSSFGEFGGDTRVSAFAAWIDSVVDIIGPQVIDLDVAGSSSIHIDYDVPVGSGQQLYTIPIGGADTFHIQFSEHVMIDADDFSLVSAINNTKSYALAASGGFAYDPVTHTATFVLADSFSGSGGGADPQPAFDQVVLTIADSVTDTAGNFLDGNWTNPTEVDQISSDVFPSGDDSPGGSFGFYLTFMPADHNFSTGSLQNKIDQGDHDAVLLNWGQNSRSFKNGDGTGEGDVDQEDLDQVLLNSGLDYTMWPGVSGMQSLSSDGSQTTSGTVWTVERRQTALDVLDSAFTRLDMEEVWKSLDVNEEVLLTSDLAWETFRDDLAAALDAYYGVSTKD
jgi:hypothetical protein